MVKKGGIPREVLEKLDIKKREKLKPITVVPIVESHQIRLTIPSEIRREIDIKKGDKFKVSFNKKKKEIIFSY